ncbi:unnamed protein product [Ilex paraguariensis]|uniref:Uncharacterized protein n=1 Tax=Ilex paraguariensis TaxID=185542 RepID=A0ABC8T1P4_9AQUA
MPTLTKQQIRVKQSRPINVICINSKTIEYELYGHTLEELKKETTRLLKSETEPPTQMKLIDSIQRLGVAYHFEEEIRDGIDHVLEAVMDLFNKFKDKKGRFMDSLSKDATGLLSLYEASHLGMNSDDGLKEAKNFSIKHLVSLAGKLDNNLAEQVKQSLQTPLYWRMPRLEARKFIDLFVVDDEKSLILSKLAKLDYNLVQSIHQQELKELAMWWRDSRFKENLSFSRDRLMENYLWAMGIIYEPQFSKSRKGLTKMVCILSAIDDMYDIYGSLDELERFTNAVNRWSIEAMEDLPEYMKLCYLAMFNSGNKVADDVLKDNGLNVLPYIKEEWTNLCCSYLLEARWFYGGHTPTLEEYFRNACTSIGGPIAIFHAYVLLGFPVAENSLSCFKLGSETIYWSSLITRICNDLGTSKAELARGDVPKSIQCYMIEEQVSEEQAYHHMKSLIISSWSNLNETIARKSHPQSLVRMSLNMARTAQCIFQNGDGIGTSTGETKDTLTSLIVTPIPIEQLDPSMMDSAGSSLG